MAEAETAVFTRTYDEALDLILETRNYVVHMRPPESRRPAAVQDLRASCEALRVTSRLTQVMAWLMIQRAVCDGEISAREACEEQHRLSGQVVCLDASADDDRGLPPGLLSLLKRSLQLYQRISRLDEMVVARVLH